MAIKTLADAFHEQLRDVFSAEKQIAKALPKMIQRACGSELKAALSAHLEETEEQIVRVEQAFKDTGKTARAKTCEAMKGLIEEAGHALEEDVDESVRDAIIIAAAQKIEHYEIATYGTLCVWARTLGYEEALGLLKQNIDEEEKADKKLSMLSTSANEEAVMAAAD